MSGPRCTFHHRYEPKCGHPEEDPIHVRENERMRHGCHVFRVELTRAEQKAKRRTR